jgi:3-oxoacyl-[acyl-carrier-protein] synthase I
MKQVYIVADNIITSLGFSTEDNLHHIRNATTGIRKCDDPKLSLHPLFASFVQSDLLEEEFNIKTGLDPASFTRFEKLCLLSATDALSKIQFSPRQNTLFILSTTKGNINLLEKDKKDLFPSEKLYLWNSARLISRHFKNEAEPMVISNACISGLLAILTGYRLIRQGLFENVVVIGCDILSEFVISGFQSFQSLSPGPCKPFDADRNGLSLGEGAGTMILTSNPAFNTYAQEIIISGGASSNDANHISGPSRTGEGLFIAISKTLAETAAKPGEIDYISAHGTATPYNDEMETQALFRSGMTNIPVNSMKGFFGHTLGAAGVIESIIGMHSILNNELYPTAGFEMLGVTENINIIKDYRQKNINNFLKLASGFGGCNAAVLFKRYAGNH